jgi:polyisoprenoid-binding protein YceI
LGFRFEKALMEEHFNENYMESTTYPNGTFEGKVANWSNGWNDGATHEVVAAGALTIHGVTVEREIPATIKWNGKAWEIESTFNVSPTDHAIEIPKMVRNKIAESLEVTVNAALAPR